MFSFLRTSLVHNSSEYIILKFEVIHYSQIWQMFSFLKMILKKNTERIDAQVWTHDVRIHVKPIAGCNSTAKKALAVKIGFFGYLKLMWGELLQTHKKKFEIPTYLFLRILFSQWNENIPVLIFERFISNSASSSVPWKYDF